MHNWYDYKKYSIPKIKCVFEISLGNFIRFMVNQRRIEAKPKKKKKKFARHAISTEYERSLETYGENGCLKFLYLTCNQILHTPFQIIIGEI